MRGMETERCTREKKNKEKLRQTLTRGQGLLCWRIGFFPSVQEWNGQVSARRGEELHELAGPEACEVPQSGVSPSRSGRRAQHNTVILHKSPIRDLGTPEARLRCLDPWAIHDQPILIVARGSVSRVSGRVGRLSRLAEICLDFCPHNIPSSQWMTVGGEYREYPYYGGRVCSISSPNSHTRRRRVSLDHRGHSYSCLPLRPALLPLLPADSRGLSSDARTRARTYDLVKRPLDARVTISRAPPQGHPKGSVLHLSYLAAAQSAHPLYEPPSLGETGPSRSCICFLRF
jgi:hypothetical protein